MAQWLFVEKKLTDHYEILSYKDFWQKAKNDIKFDDSGPINYNVAVIAIGHFWTEFSSTH